MPTMKPGCLLGIGVGPGDPELLTLKAVRLLQEAPAIAFVAADGRPSLARHIAARYIPPHKREINIALPLDPQPQLAEAAHNEGASRIAAELELGHDVALLCEGDPLFHGSFVQFFGRLGQRYRSIVVPGILALNSATAAARLPLVWRTNPLAVLSAALPAVLLKNRLAASDAAAVLDIGWHVRKLKTVLAELDLLDRAIYVERPSTADERVMLLTDVATAAAPHPAVVLIPARR